MNRRLFLAIVLTAILVLTVSVGGLATAQDDSPYAPYAGDTIVVSWPSLFHFERAATLIPQFTEETGINVEVDFIQYQNMKTAQETELQRPRVTASTTSSHGSSSPSPSTSRMATSPRWRSSS
jgi:ABC-type glycerol-3-phosphate transport system substrate-binding protein